MLCYGKDPKLANGMGCHPDAIVHTEASEKSDHPCPKPINFWVWLMNRVALPECVIFEPFTGSGTGVIAAEQTGRKCYGMEISPRYIDVTVRRWQDYTGKAATLEDGRTFDEVKAERAESDA
jgi:DNA modification methylase